MKNNLIVILCFTAGIFCGTFANTTISTYCEKLPQFLLYALVIQVGLNLGANADGKGYPVFQFVTAVLYDHRHVSILCGGEFVIDLVEYI